jgi:hypothetical protein
MRILALDLSKRSAGYGCWGEDDAVVTSGVWVLGSEYTSMGRTFCNLHEEMSGLASLGAIDAIFYEEPLNPGPHAGMTNAETIKVLNGLAMHAESWGTVMQCRIIRAVNQSSWRRSFLGKMPRATKSAQLKDYAMVRCRQLGFKPRKHDEAEAIGILDYACETLDITPPWRANEVLRPMLALP